MWTTSKKLSNKYNILKKKIKHSIVGGSLKYYKKNEWIVCFHNYEKLILNVELLKTRDYNLILEIKEYVNTDISMDKNDFTKTTKTIPNCR